MKLTRWAGALFSSMLLLTSCRTPDAARMRGILYGDDGGPYGTSYLYLLEPDSGIQHLLAAGEEGEVGLATADPSPDGTKVVFSKQRHDQPAEIWVLPLDGSEPWPLLKGAIPPHVGVPLWSFDGRKIAFISTTTYSDEPCHNEFYVVDLASGSMTKLPVRGSSCSWSPSDNRIAVLCNEGEDQGVNVVDTDTLEVSRLAPTLYMPNFSLAWSRDAKEIGVVRKAAVFMDELFLLNVASGEGRAVSQTAGYLSRHVYYPTWSSQGDKIAFVASYSKGASKANQGRALYVLDLRTGVESQVADEVSYGVWSPDGQELVFRAAGSNVDWGRMSRVNLTTGRIQQLTDARGHHLCILGWGSFVLPSVGPLAGKPAIRLDVPRTTLTPSAALGTSAPPPSAESDYLIGNSEMRFMLAIETRTDSVGQFLAREQVVDLIDTSFRMSPAGLNRIEPGALGGR